MVAKEFYSEHLLVFSHPQFTPFTHFLTMLSLLSNLSIKSLETMTVPNPNLL